jgi:hypothetical protein
VPVFRTQGRRSQGIESRYARFPIVRGGFGGGGVSIPKDLQHRDPTLDVRPSASEPQTLFSTSEMMCGDGMVLRVVGTVCEAKCSIFEISSIHA